MCWTEGFQNQLSYEQHAGQHNLSPPPKCKMKISQYLQELDVSTGKPWWEPVWVVWASVSGMPIERNPWGRSSSLQQFNQLFPQKSWRKWVGKARSWRSLLRLFFQVIGKKQAEFSGWMYGWPWYNYSHWYACTDVCLRAFSCSVRHYWSSVSFNICGKFHGRFSSCCWDISLWATSLKLALEKKIRDTSELLGDILGVL